jgi:ABC-type antimicrobial peptide transport system permease subunit
MIVMSCQLDSFAAKFDCLLGLEWSVVGGVLTGIALAVILNTLLSRWIQDSTLNAPILLGVVLLLVATSCLSCFVPARRASSVDPMVALRYE